MQLKQILQIGKEKLKNVSQTSSLDVEILVSHVLDLTRTDLILKDDLELSQEQEKQILELIERRVENEPIAYLINEKEFYGLKFYVDENVLIPRPETEVLVEAVKSLKLKVKSNLIVDVGMGSGCIPISLAKNLEDVDFVGIDVSEEALEVARRNVERFGLGDRIELRRGNLLEGMNPWNKSGDDKNVGVPLVGTQNKEIIITANLPYVENEAELGSEVRDYEPHLALFAGEDGLDCYRKLLKQVQTIKPLAVFLEIDPKQVEALKEISKKNLPEYKIEIKKDLEGKERVFVFIKNW